MIMNNQIPDYVKKGHRSPNSSVWKKKNNIPTPTQAALILKTK